MIIRKHIAATAALIAALAAPLISGSMAATASVEVPRISAEQANQMLGHTEVVFIDVRTAKSWWRSPTKIANAIRVEPGAVKQWAPKYARHQTLIFYCS